MDYNSIDWGWFAWLGFRAFFMMLYAGYLLNTSSWGAIMSNASDRAVWVIAWPRALSFFVYAGLAYYFLKKGSRFVELISNESPGCVSKDGSPVVEQHPFRAWLAEDGSCQYLSLEDQRREFASNRAD